MTKLDKNAVEKNKKSISPNCCGKKSSRLQMECIPGGTRILTGCIAPNSADAPAHGNTLSPLIIGPWQTYVFDRSPCLWQWDKTHVLPCRNLNCSCGSKGPDELVATISFVSALLMRGSVFMTFCGRKIVVIVCGQIRSIIKKIILWDYSEFSNCWSKVLKRVSEISELL